MAGKLEDVEVVFSVSPPKPTRDHFGSKLVFLPDGTIELTAGDGWDFRERAQNPAVQLGKTIRLNDDGCIPADNPFTGVATGNDAVWTLGTAIPRVWLTTPSAENCSSMSMGPAAETKSTCC